MDWVIFAIVAAFLYAVSNFFDKFIIKKKNKRRCYPGYFRIADNRCGITAYSNSNIDTLKLPRYNKNAEVDLITNKQYE